MSSTLVMDLRIQNSVIAAVSGLLVISCSNYPSLTTEILVTYISNISNFISFCLYLGYENPSETNLQTRIIFYIVGQILAVISDVCLFYLLNRITTMYNVGQSKKIGVLGLSLAILGSLTTIFYKTLFCFNSYGNLYKITFPMATSQTLLIFRAAWSLIILSISIIHLYLIGTELEKSKRREICVLLFLKSSKTAIYIAMCNITYLILAFPPLSLIPNITPKIVNLLYMGIKMQVYLMVMKRLRAPFTEGSSQTGMARVTKT
ncbi:hypothetical protein BC833DRAFT_590766 [Globomyces pollinis-pini]|nr:hypothetical protein BC833DRAFT_590766 [Globomyces pollinis-pini]